MAFVKGVRYRRIWSNYLLAAVTAVLFVTNIILFVRPHQGQALQGSLSTSLQIQPWTRKSRLVDTEAEVAQGDGEGVSILETQRAKMWAATCDRCLVHPGTCAKYGR